MSEEGKKEQIWVIPLRTLKDKHQHGNADKLPKGTHVVVEKCMGLYDHHAILAEDTTLASVRMKQAVVYHHNRGGCWPCNKKEGVSLSDYCCPKPNTGTLKRFGPRGMYYKAEYPAIRGNESTRWENADKYISAEDINKPRYNPITNNCESFVRKRSLNLGEKENCCCNICSPQVWTLLFVLFRWAFLHFAVYLAIDALFGSMEEISDFHKYIFEAISMILLEMIFVIFYYTSCCFYRYEICSLTVVKPCCFCKPVLTVKNCCNIRCCVCCCCKGDAEMFRKKQKEHTITRKQRMDGCCALSDIICREIWLLFFALTGSIIFEMFLCRPDNETWGCWSLASLIGMAGAGFGYIFGGIWAFWINMGCYKKRCYSGKGEIIPHDAENPESRGSNANDVENKKRRDIGDDSDVEEIVYRHNDHGNPDNAGSSDSIASPNSLENTCKRDGANSVDSADNASNANTLKNSDGVSFDNSDQKSDASSVAPSRITVDIENSPDTINTTGTYGISDTHVTLDMPNDLDKADNLSISGSEAIYDDVRYGGTVTNGKGSSNEDSVGCSDSVESPNIISSNETAVGDEIDGLVKADSVSISDCDAIYVDVRYSGTENTCKGSSNEDGVGCSDSVGNLNAVVVAEIEGDVDTVEHPDNLSDTETVVNIDVDNVGENVDTIGEVERKDNSDSVCNPNRVCDNLSDVDNDSLSDECSDQHAKL